MAQPVFGDKHPHGPGCLGWLGPASERVRGNGQGPTCCEALAAGVKAEARWSSQGGDGALGARPNQSHARQRIPCGGRLMG